MALFHFSENGDLARFLPRPPMAHPETPPFVWAIDEWHSPLYFFPSDCPRVAFWPLPSSSSIDLEKWWQPVSGRMVLAIEAAWLSRLQTTTMYRYRFDPGPFIDTGDHGVFVSSEPVVPLSVDSLDDLPAQILAADCELRICPSLVALAKAVMKSSLHWSLIRMRNANGWDLPGGSPTLPTLPDYS